MTCGRNADSIFTRRHLSLLDLYSHVRRKLLIQDILNSTLFPLLLYILYNTPNVQRARMELLPAMTMGRVTGAEGLPTLPNPFYLTLQSPQVALIPPTFPSALEPISSPATFHHIAAEQQLYCLPAR